jgi:hypothetical protein
MNLFGYKLYVFQYVDYTVFVSYELPDVLYSLVHVLGACCV